jgi:hypothetical protein
VKFCNFMRVVGGVSYAVVDPNWGWICDK